jgi:hypothetical protein
VNSVRTLCGNLFCLAGSLPGYVRFQHASRYPERYQAKRMRRLLHDNRATDYGREHGFEQVDSRKAFAALPLTEYADYDNAIERIMNGDQRVLTADHVNILQPTSGTSSRSKLIPYTAALGAEFKAALDAWLFDLYRQRPKLLLGPQYWSISPAIERETRAKGNVPIGFLDDAEYFGARRRWIMDAIMAVPSDVRMIADMEANQYVTLLFLLREKRLRLISVWHPSFLTLLLKVMRDRWPHLLADLARGGIAPDVDVPDAIRRRLAHRLRPQPRRARELGALASTDEPSPGKMWPKLEVISCWRDGHVASEITELQGYFPRVLIQGKGLLATEGVVSIPVGPSQQHVCAVTSHVLEFQDSGGVVHPLWDVKRGETYCVILTTAGGLYRYQLRDRIQVVGMHRRTPCIRFLGRAGVVSDCVGEKLHLEHAETAIATVSSQHFKQPCFALLVPSSRAGERRYTLLIEAKGAEGEHDLAAAATTLERELRHNFHYSHARRLGQLETAAVTLLEPGAQSRYRDVVAKAGGIAGTVKFPALCMIEGMEAHLLAIAGKGMPE